MAVYKCKDCSHEVIKSFCPSECDICGGSSVILLEHFNSAGSTKESDTLKKPKDPTPFTKVKTEKLTSSTKKKADKSIFPAKILRSLKFHFILVGIISLISGGAIGIHLHLVNKVSSAENNALNSSSAQSCIGVQYRFFPQINIDSDRGLSNVSFIIDILPGMPADIQGLQKGDIVIEIGDREIIEFSSMQDIVRSFDIGEKVPVVVLRPNAYKINEIEEDTWEVRVTPPYTQLNFEVPTAPCPP